MCEIVCSVHKIACKKHNNTFITLNNDLGPFMMRFTNDFHSWLRHSWKSIANRLTCDPKIVIHGNSCIILYIPMLEGVPSELIYGNSINILGNR